MNSTEQMLARVRAAMAEGRLPSNALAVAEKQIENQKVIGSQRVLLNPPYYSRVRLLATYAAGPPVVLTWPAGQRVYAFGYGQGEDMTGAGFAGVAATPADTNITASRETEEGQIVEIHGIQIQPVGLVDAFVANQLGSVVSVGLRFGAKRWMDLGLLGEIPGGSGGNPGNTAVLEPAAPSTTGDRVYYPGKFGNLAFGNALRFPEPVLWTPKGANQRFDVELTVERAFAHTCPVARAAATSGAGAGNDILAYAPPAANTAMGGHLELMVKLLTRTMGPRSVNS